jgi:hypothetical protein
MLLIQIANKMGLQTVSTVKHRYLVEISEDVEHVDCWSIYEYYAFNKSINVIIVPKPSVYSLTRDNNLYFVQSRLLENYAESWISGFIQSPQK